MRSPDSCETATPVCHWDRIPGRAIDGRHASHAVWVCEFPFRTLMPQVPHPDDCEGCPVQSLLRARVRAGTVTLAADPFDVPVAS